MSHLGRAVWVSGQSLPGIHNLSVSCDTEWDTWPSLIHRPHPSLCVPRHHYLSAQSSFEDSYRQELSHFPVHRWRQSDISVSSRRWRERHLAVSLAYCCCCYHWSVLWTEVLAGRVGFGSGERAWRNVRLREYAKSRSVRRLQESEVVRQENGGKRKENEWEEVLMVSELCSGAVTCLYSLVRLVLKGVMSDYCLGLVRNFPRLIILNRGTS